MTAGESVMSVITHAPARPFMKIANCVNRCTRINVVKSRLRSGDHILPFGSELPGSPLRVVSVIATCHLLIVSTHVAIYLRAR